jgi:hypothetical protein
MSGNVLDYIAKGVNSDYGGSFVEGLTSGREAAALRQKMEEARRVRNALQQAGTALQGGQYPTAANYMTQAGEPNSAVNLLQSSDPNLLGNKEKFGVTPIMLEGPHGEQIPYQLSSAGRGQAVDLPEGTRISTKWQYLPDPYGNYYPVPKQGSGNQPGVESAPQTPYAPPGEPEKVKAAATQQGEIAGKTQAEAAKDLPAAESRLDYTIQNVDDLINHPGLKYSVGLANKAIGFLNPAHWQEVADFSAKAKTVNGQSLLAMLDMLKALRPVSNEESKSTATAAVQLDSNQNPEQYVKGLRYYQDFLKRNNDILRRQAAGSSQGAPSGGGGRIAMPTDDPRMTPEVWGRMSPEDQQAWINSK